MTSGRERPSSSQPPTTVPNEFPNVTPQSAMVDHSFTLQAVMELQKSVAELATKTDRLIKDVEGQGTKIDAVRHQISFVKGAVWVIGGILAMGVAAITIYMRVIPH
jgi:hypothetical protein